MAPRANSSSLALGFLILAALALYLPGIGWGWAEAQLWSWDEVRPTAVLATPYDGADAWPVRYPLLHRDLLRGLYALLDPAAGALGAETPLARERFFFLAGRGLTVLLSVVTVALAFATARRLGSGKRAAFLAALVWLATLPQAYYAKTTNLDAPYLFWFALAVWGLVRHRLDGSPSGLALFAFAAGAATLTKDQAFALFLLPALLALVRALRTPASDGGRRPALRSLAAGAGAALLLAVATYRVPMGLAPFSRHVAALLEHPTTYGFTAPDLAGPWAAVRLALRHVAWSFGWPLALFVAAGAVVALVAAWRRGGAEPRAAAALLLFPLSYVLCFLVPLGYQYDRFFLPICWTLAVVSGCGIARAIEGLPAAAPRLAFWTFLLGAVGWGIARGVALDAAMLHDRRYELEVSSRGLARLAVYAHEVRAPNGFARQRLARHEELAIDALAPYELVAIPGLDAGDRAVARLVAQLRRGACGFRPVRPELAAPSSLRRWVRFEGVLSNLSEIDPPQLVFARSDPRRTCADEPAAQ